MNLEAKYKLPAPLSQGTVAFDQLIKGQEAATGRPVSIHILAGGNNSENQKLFKQIEELPREYKIVFLEVGEHKGNPVVVTDALAGAPPFRIWFASIQAKLGIPVKKDSTNLLKHSAWQIPVQVNAPIPPAVTNDVSVGSSTSMSGEFTRMFEVEQSQGSENPSLITPPSPTKTAPGEFTQMFQLPDAVSKESTEPAAVPQALNPIATQPPGEFTQVLRAPVQETASPVPSKLGQLQHVSDDFDQLFKTPASVSTEAVAMPVAEPPGEFTQLFQTPQVSARPSSVGRPVTELPPTQKPAGEFTQLFQAHAPNAESSQPAGAAPGEFTSLFQTPVVSAKSASVTSTAQPSPVTRQPDPDATLIFQATAPVPKINRPAPSSPGEFTQMFASPQDSIAPPRSAPAAFDALFNQSPAEEDSPRINSAPAANSQPGEFTRMLESPLARSGLKPQKAVSPQLEGFSMKGESNGFAQMLDSPVSPHSDAPSVPSPLRQEKPTGDATRAFRFPEGPVSPALPASEPPPAAGPSEFTQMFKAPTKQEEPKAEKPAAKSARVKPRRKPNTAYLKWVLAASGILLVIALVVFFAVRD